MNLGYYVISALVVLITLAIHEYCHAYAAYKLGDNTARDMGRLTLNPLKHLDPVGAICMLLFHVGWAKPVPINPRNFKNPKKGFAITAIAGPLSNIVMAFFGALVYIIILASLRGVLFVRDSFEYNFWNNVLLFVSLFHTINLGLGIFNLLPIPPFDGSRIFLSFLPPKYYWKIMQYERYIYMAFLILLVIGVFDKPINIARNFVLDLILDLFIRI